MAGVDIAVADPRILQQAGGVSGGKLPGPEDLALAQERLAKAQETRQKLIEDARDQAAMKTAYQSSLDEQGHVDPDKLYTALTPYPKLYEKAQTHFADIRTKAANAAHIEAETNDKDASLLASLANGVGENGEGYDYFRQRAVAIDPRAEKFLSPQYDPQQIQFVKSAGTSVAEANKIEKENRDSLLGGNLPVGAGRILGAIQGQDPEKNEASWQQGLAQIRTLTLGQKGAKAVIDAYPQHWSPEAVQQMNAQAQTPEQRAVQAERQQVHADALKEQARDDIRQEGAAKSLEQYRAANLAAKAKAGAGGGAGTAAQRDIADVQEAVRGMSDHTIPPQLPGRSSREYTAIMAEAHRQKVDLVRLNEDWNATQKYLATMNGATQVRFRQAVKFAKDSVPLVRSLVNEWDAGQFPLLNKANLLAAKNGVYGPKAASVASRLSAQIADMTSELGTVYKGGNTSTDESLKLAAENLKGDWSKQTALDALKQIEKNIEIRDGSIKFGAPIGNEGNPYAPTQPKPPDTVAPGQSIKTGKYTVTIIK